VRLPVPDTNLSEKRDAVSPPCLEEALVRIRLVFFESVTDDAGSRDLADDKTANPQCIQSTSVLPNMSANMSDIEEIWVAPNTCRNPSVPAGTARVPIHPISLWPVGKVTSVLVFPGEIDRARLIQAVENVAALWPNIAGRYEQSPPQEGKDPAFDFSVNPILSYPSLLANNPVPPDVQYYPRIFPNYTGRICIP